MKFWLLSAIPFMMLGSLHIISNRIDILMVGALRGTEISGIYQPVSRGAQLLTFVPAAVGRNLAAKIAHTNAGWLADKKLWYRVVGFPRDIITSIHGV